jgi:hypothetical protein
VTRRVVSGLRTLPGFIVGWTRPSDPQSGLLVLSLRGTELRCLQRSTGQFRSFRRPPLNIAEPMAELSRIEVGLVSCYPANSSACCGGLLRLCRTGAGTDGGTSRQISPRVGAERRANYVSGPFFSFPSTFRTCRSVQSTSSAISLGVASGLSSAISRIACSFVPRGQPLPP